MTPKCVLFVIESSYPLFVRFALNRGKIERYFHLQGALFAQFCDLAQTISITSNSAAKLQLPYQYQKPNFRKVQALHTITRSAQKRTKLNKYGTYAITSTPPNHIAQNYRYVNYCPTTVQYSTAPTPHLTTPRKMSARNMRPRESHESSRRRPKTADSNQH